MAVGLLGLLLPGVALGFSPRGRIVASRTALAMEICPEISTEPRRPKHEVVRGGVKEGCGRMSSLSQLRRDRSELLLRCTVPSYSTLRQALLASG